LGEITAALDARLALAGASPQKRALFARAARLVAASVALTHADLRRRLQSKYLPFYAASNRQPLFSSKPPTQDQLDAGELEFVRSFVDALLAARYSPLTRQQQRAALTAAFRLSVPARVEFARLDSSLLSRFWRSTPPLAALRGRLPRTADRVAIFHRGVGVARARGLFLAEKLDLLARYCVVGPLTSLGQFLRLAVLGRLVFLARVLLRSVLRVARRVSPFSSAFVVDAAAERALEARGGAAPADAVWGGGTASVSGTTTTSSSSSGDDEDDEDDGEEDDDDEDDAAGWLGYFDESSSSSSSSSGEEDEEEEGEVQQQDATTSDAEAATPTAAPPAAVASSSGGFESALSSLDEERELYARWRRRQRRRRQRALDQWANTSVGEEAVAPAALHDGRHLVARRTLAHVLPNARAVARSFFKPVELQEPAFGEVIILYREREEGEAAEGAAAAADKKEEQKSSGEAAGAAAAATGAAADGNDSPALLPLRKRLHLKHRQEPPSSIIGAEAVARSGGADVVAGWQQRLALQAQAAQENVAGAVASAATAAAEAAQAAASAATAAAEAAITTAEAKPGALASSALAGLAQGVLSGDDAGGVRETVVSAGQRMRMSPGGGGEGGGEAGAAAVAAAAAASTAATAAEAAAAAAAAAVESTSAAASAAAAANNNNDDPLLMISSPPMPYARNIQLRRFRDVPLADLELCVPFVELGVRAAQALRLAVATLGAVIAAFAAVAEGHREAVAVAAAAATATVVGAPPPAPCPRSLLPILWGFLAGMIGAALHARDEIAAQRAQALTSLLELQQSKCSECQGAVIGVVSEALAESTLKEALLAYGVLLAAREEGQEQRGGDGEGAGGGLTANEVSQRAQRLLSRDLGVHGAVFTARAVLPALERAGLVVRRPGSSGSSSVGVGGGRRHHHWPSSSSSPSRPASSSSADTYEAVPLEAGVRVLEQDWATAHERVDLTLASASESEEGEEERGSGNGAGEGPGVFLSSSPWLRHAPATTPSPSPPPPLAAAAVATAARVGPSQQRSSWRRQRPAVAVAAPPRPLPLRPLMLAPRPMGPRRAALLAAAAHRRHPLIGAF
jgi:hypothetical protein